jgi:lipoprotein NlpI
MLKAAQWPIPVVSLYLGSASSQVVLSSAQDPNPRKDVFQRCEAYFYIGEDALLHGRKDEAKAMFEQAIATGVTSFYEYNGAIVELARMKAPL